MTEQSEEKADQTPAEQLFDMAATGERPEPRPLDSEDIYLLEHGVGGEQPGDKEALEQAKEPEEERASSVNLEAESEGEAGGEDLSEFLSVLRRDKVPEKVIEAMSPEGIKALAEIAKERQSRDADAYRVYNENKKQEESAKEPQEESAEQSGVPAVGPPDEMLDNVVGPLGDYLDDGEKQAFKESLAKAIDAAAQAKVDTFGQQVTGVYTDLAVKIARLGLSAQPRYARLADNETWEAVYEQAQKADASKYASYEALLEDAAKAVLGEVMDPAAQAEELTSQQLRDESTPTTATQKTVPAPLSVEDQEDAWLDAQGIGQLPRKY